MTQAPRAAYGDVECGVCLARYVRLYRPGGNFYRPGDNRCLACVDEKTIGWMVPLVLSATGEPWGYTSAPAGDIETWLNLRETALGGIRAAGAEAMLLQLQEQLS